jgi:hypothetical protein
VVKYGTNHKNLPFFLFAAIAGPQPFKSCCQLTEDSSSRHRTILSTLAATLCFAPGRTRRRGGSSTCVGTAERTRRKRPGRASTGESSNTPNSECIADAGACARSHICPPFASHAIACKRISISGLVSFLSRQAALRHLRFACT